LELNKRYGKIRIFLFFGSLTILAIVLISQLVNWISSPSEGVPSAQGLNNILGPTCYIDHLNQFNIHLQPGWRAGTPPDINAIGGTSIIYNYNPNDIKGNHGFYDLPANATKIEITSAKLKENQSFEQWVEELVSESQGVDRSGQLNIIVTNPKPYSVGKFDGLAFKMGTNNDDQRFLILIDAGNGLILLIIITPANSPELYDALLMLNTINIGNHDICS